MDYTFSGIYEASTGITLGTFLICIAAALVLGTIMALVYGFKNQHSSSFSVTLALLPGAVAVVIMLVNGNLGAGVAVAGAFSLVRFRSTPGTAKEITAIFLAMATGLACGMGYLTFATIFTLIMCVLNLIFTLTNFGGHRNASACRVLRITVPEDLDYPTIFDDLFEKYTTQYRLTCVKTTNLGSLNRLTYDVTLRKPGTEKAFIDELRCRNGNLEISMSLQSTELQQTL